MRQKKLSLESMGCADSRNINETPQQEWVWVWVISHQYKINSLRIHWVLSWVTHLMKALSLIFAYAYRKS